MKTNVAPFLDIQKMLLLCVNPLLANSKANILSVRKASRKKGYQVKPYSLIFIYSAYKNQSPVIFDPVCKLVLIISVTIGNSWSKINF